jgi:hypothetical protein
MLLQLARARNACTQETLCSLRFANLVHAVKLDKAKKTIRQASEPPKESSVLAKDGAAADGSKSKKMRF